MSNKHYLLQLIEEAEKEFDIELTEIETEAENLIDEWEHLKSKNEDLKENVESLEEQVSELEDANPIEFDNNTHNNIVTQTALETILRNMNYIPVQELVDFANKYDRV